jgi:DNA primase
MLKGRVAIPLHDPQGRLVGYAGRITKDEMIGPKCPKYLFPGEREKNGVKLEFRKSLLLYNAHRINAPVDHLFVVEGFPAVWWLHQNGFEKVVALMGSSCSVEQAEEIVKLVPETGIVWIVSDGDIAGEHCAVGIFKAVAPRRRVRWPRLDRGKQPTSLDQIALKGLLPTI